MVTTEQIIGKNISALRKKQGYSYQQISEYLGLTKPEYVSMESGSVSIDITHLEKLAKLFGIDAFDLYEKDISTNKSIFAFKAKRINSEDLKSVASFMKIIMNHRRMKKEYEANDTAN